VSIVATQAWIGLGANLGEPLAALHGALEALATLDSCTLLRHSSLYRTTPIGPGVENQPDYINAVAEISTTLSATALLEALFAIESHFGRQRSARNAARTLDLDLLLYGDAQINTPSLIVPHPRMHERAFVLSPLAELAPQTLIPGRGRVADLIATLDDQGIQRLTD
jgi:2-amino-4-hydroxy-6-hydroxymethyldihydropteridine diphosphokinase